MQKKKGFIRSTIVCAAMVGLLCNFMSLEVEASTPEPLESRSVVDLESVEFSDLVGLSEQYFHTESQYDLEDALQTPEKYVTQSMITNISSGVFSKVGNYSVTSPTENELKLAYESLAIGDGLVKNGHCFLVVANIPAQQKVMVIEQTPPKTTYTTYTYADLAEEKYRPFSYN